MIHAQQTLSSQHAFHRLAVVRAVALGVACTALIGASAHAQTTTFQVTAKQDTTVNRWLPFSNAGAQSFMTVDGLSWPDQARALVKFDGQDVVSGLGTDGLVSARLVFTIVAPQIVVGSPAIAVHRMTSSWSQSTATWYSLFGLLGATPFVAQPSCSIAVTTVSTGQVSCDVTADVLDMLAHPGLNHGWLLKEEVLAAGVAVHLGSRESLAPPGS